MSTHHESRITKNNRKNKKAMKALIVSKMKDSCTTAKRLERTNISRKEISKPSEMENFNPEHSCGNFCKLLPCKVRIGSYETKPASGVIFSTLGIRIPVTPTKGGNTINLNIDVGVIVKLLYHMGKDIPAVFLYVNATCATKIREQLGMDNPENNYLDPTSSNETVRRITITLERVTEHSKTFIKTAYSALTSGAGKVAEEINQDESNTIIMSTSSPEAQETVRRVAKSATQLSQPSKMLLIYPPPPMKGGISITVDDYQVLEEESFLNDVILDFFLK